MSKKIIVTGGAGFIGRNLVKSLNDKGHKDIIVVDNLGSGTKWKNLVGLNYTDYFHKQDFINQIDSHNLWKDVCTVYHMGACSSTTETNCDYLMENNFKYSCKIATKALEVNARFIYASSAATYGLGESGYSDTHDSLDQLKPLNMYGYSKHIFDLWCRDKNILDKVCGIKFFNVYGPHEIHKGGQSSLIPRAKEQFEQNGFVKLFKSTTSRFKDGEQLRDFVYVKDCVDVLIWLADNPNINGIFNLGTGKAQSWNQLASAVAKALNVECKIQYIDMPDNLINQYQDFTEADMSKLISAGYSGTFRNLDEGVKDYFNQR
jgi:ADP-L-glycero-D-manno-heptose 6-epimerase